MSNITRQEIVKMGRQLCLQGLWERYREFFPDKVKDEKSQLERNGIDIPKLKANFSKATAEYLETVADKDKEIKELNKDINAIFREYIAEDLEGLTEAQRKLFEFNLTKYSKC